MVSRSCAATRVRRLGRVAIHISIWTQHIGRSSSNLIPGQNQDADSVDTEHLDKNEDPGDADVETDGVKEQCCHKSK